MKKSLLFSVIAMAATALVGCTSGKLDGTSLSVDPTGTKEVESKKQEIEVEVTADCEWVATCDAEWIKLSSESGSGDGKVIVYVEANTSGERSAIVHFQKSTTRKISADVTIKQASGLDIKPGDGTKENPYLASQAAEIASQLASESTTPDKVYVKGYVKKFGSKHESGISGFGNALFYITDDAEGTVTPDFYCYQVYYLGGAKFTSVDQIKLGDEVVVYGKLTNYNGTPETEGKGAAYIYSLNGRSSDSGSEGGESGQQPDPSTLKDVTVAEFIAAEASQTQMYRLSGTIHDVQNTQYGNFYLKDETGSVLIYGLTNIDEYRDKLLPGATVIVKGIRAEYNGTIEMKEATCEKMEGGAPEEKKPGEYLPADDFEWGGDAVDDTTYGKGYAGKSKDEVLEVGIYKYQGTTDLVLPTDLVKVYKNSVIVIKSTKPFTKVVFHSNQDKKYSAVMTVLKGDGAVAADQTNKTVTWEGAATSEIVLHANESQVRISKFAFTF